MKTILLFLLLFPVFCFSQMGKAQGGEFKFNTNNIPCISEEAKEKIAIEVDANITVLKKQGKLSIRKVSLAAPQFIWPVRKASTVEFNEVWAISNYVDHDNTSGLEDFNCGTKTYNGHKGTDIYTWPFSWYQQENNLAEVVAAAPGVIYYKQDGEFDKNCVNNTSLQWNAVYVRHSDNSYAWYGHLKSGSLTSKNLGDTVAAGEYLGVVGSSGNSSGPHLHFEVYDSSNNLVDPYNGTCNNDTSWWQNQPDYSDPNINAVLTHSSPPVFNTCPTTETTNLQDKFLPNSVIYLAGYFRDQLANTTFFLRLTRPDGSRLQWSENFSNAFGSSYWYWSVNNLSDIGTYTIQITYQGQRVSHEFEVATTLGVEDEKLAKVLVSPNPFETQVNISGLSLDQADYKIDVFNQLGQKVIEKNEFTEQLDLQFLSKGLYFLTIENKANGGSKSFKLIKN